MKILVIICSDKMSPLYSENIKILNDYIREDGKNIVEYCGISNYHDFHNYTKLISFKYKIINTKKQLSKICDFISEYKKELDYDWYIKFRPNVKLLEAIDFNKLSHTAINGRARVYIGPKSIKHGLSVGGRGNWEDVKGCFYNDNEIEASLDDQLFIFNNHIIELGAFNRFDKYHDCQNEAHQAWLWKERNILTNVIGINILFMKIESRIYSYSGDVNM